MQKLHKNQSGVVNHLALLIVGVVVLAGVGFAGNQVYNAKYGVNAKASGGWTAIATGVAGVGLKGCRVNSNTTWVYVLNNSNNAVKVSGGGRSFSQPAHSNSSAWTLSGTSVGIGLNSSSFYVRPTSVDFC